MRQAVLWSGLAVGFILVLAAVLLTGRQLPEETKPIPTLPAARAFPPVPAPLPPSPAQNAPAPWLPSPRPVTAATPAAPAPIVSISWDHEDAGGLTGILKNLSTAPLENIYVYGTTSRHLPTIPMPVQRLTGYETHSEGDAIMSSTVASRVIPPGKAGFFTIPNADRFNIRDIEVYTADPETSGTPRQQIPFVVVP